MIRIREEKNEEFNLSERIGKVLLTENEKLGKKVIDEDLKSKL